MKAPTLETIGPDPQHCFSVAAGRVDTNAVSERGGYFISVPGFQAMNETRFTLVLPTLDGVSLNKAENIASHKIMKCHYCLKHIRPNWLGQFTEHFHKYSGFLWTDVMIFEFLKFGCDDNLSAFGARSTDKRE